MEPTRHASPDPLAALTDGLVDYAGLFPPAALPMEAAVARHGEYLAGPHARRLGRFVVPVARLGELAAARAAAGSGQAGPAWQLSALAGPEPAADCAKLQAFQQAHAPAMQVVSIETRAATPSDVGKLTAPFPADWEVWVEIPATTDPTPFVAAIAAAGRGAKLRTGGVVPEAFPSPGAVAGFLRSCHARGVVAKATAGLHHPVSGRYPLTYEPASTRGRMFGFLNVFLAAALIQAGGAVAEAEALLLDEDPAGFRCAEGAISWRNHTFPTDRLAATRGTLLRSFGSCSFTEPIEGLQELGWL